MHLPSGSGKVLVRDVQLRVLFIRAAADVPVTGQVADSRLAAGPSSVATFGGGSPSLRPAPTARD